MRRGLVVAVVVILAVLAGVAADRWLGFRRTAQARVEGPALLVFVRTDCPISNKYAPELERIRKEYSARLGHHELIYVDESGPAHAREHGLGWPVTADVRRALARRYGVSATPEAVVIDRAGGLAYRGRIDDRFVAFGKQRPEATSHELRDALDAVLAGAPPRVRRTEVVGCPVQRVLGSEGAGATWENSVATIIHDRCSGCHRPGASGPFPLLTYEQVVDRAAQIEQVIEDGFMPPWKPVGPHGAFVGDRRLTPWQSTTLRAWLAADAPPGDLALAPRPPAWPRGWALGEPDQVVTLAASFDVPAEGRDIYRNFVIPVAGAGSSAAPRHVRAWAFRPGVPAAVHHAIVSADALGWARRQDAKSPDLPGFEGMDLGDVQSPDGFYLVWAPGHEPGQNPGGLTWALAPGSDLVLQLHLQPTGKPESVRPEIALWFADVPSEDRAFSLRIGDVPIDIPAGATEHRIVDTLTLAAPATAVAVFPHAHYLARTFRLTADDRVLLAIDDWDFNWQDDYVFAGPTPPSLPAGAQLRLEITYDNSAANVRNPSRPPRRVVAGPRSEDEMGNVTLTLIPNLAADPAAHSKLRQAAARRLTQRTPSDHRAWFNLANALDFDPPAATAAYDRALALQPDFVHAHVNKAIALHRQGPASHAAARHHAERALQLDPTQSAAMATLALLDGATPRSLAATARAHLEAGRLRESEAAYVLALSLVGDSQAPATHAAATAAPLLALPHAHADLAVLLLRTGRPAAALHHLQIAARLLPDDAAIQANLSRLSAALSPSRSGAADRSAGLD